MEDGVERMGFRGRDREEMIVEKGWFGERKGEGILVRREYVKV